MGLLDNETQQDYYNGDAFGGYQFTSLNDIINQFMIAYVGEDKLISKVKRTEVAFHAQRAMQELSFDTFKSCKSQEITLPPSNTMMLPQDYVNYTKVCWVDSSGVEHPLYPTKHTSNPIPILQNSDGVYTLTAIGTMNLTATTENLITLDAEYANIQVGMKVLAPSIPTIVTIAATTSPAAAAYDVDASFVGSTSNNGGITTIGLVDKEGNDVNALYAGDETLTFENVDGSLILEQETSFILEGLAWVSASLNKITAASLTDAAQIKVGMIVSHEFFNSGTTVVDVNGVVITTSEDATAVSTATTNEVTFIGEQADSTTWDSYKSSTPSENNNNNYENNTYWSLSDKRYGLESSHAQVNGSYYIDCNTGLIHFSSNVSGKTVILKYISDGLGTDEEMRVHKFAEEAMYKWLMHAILSTRRGVQEYVVARYRKEKIAATRKAKLRLSNIKLEEITQILRGKSKWIKH